MLIKKRSWKKKKQEQKDKRKQPKGLKIKEKE